MAARRHARTELARGAPASVLLTDTHGAPPRVVRLTATPRSGWTCAALTAAVRAALPGLPRLRTLAGTLLTTGPAPLSGHAPGVGVAAHRGVTVPGARQRESPCAHRSVSLLVRNTA
jgi:hypothetical protein